MRSGITITLRPADRLRLEALVRDRNTVQKHVWRAQIVLFSTDGIGTKCNDHEISRQRSVTDAALLPKHRRSTKTC